MANVNEEIDKSALLCFHRLALQKKNERINSHYFTRAKNSSCGALKYLVGSKFAVRTKPTLTKTDVSSSSPVIALFAD